MLFAEHSKRVVPFQGKSNTIHEINMQTGYKIHILTSEPEKQTKRPAKPGK
jgi:hypothetical protein